LPAPRGRHANPVRGAGGAELPVFDERRAAVTPFSSDPRLTREHLESLVAKMAERRIVVVGDAMLDIYLSGDADRISPEAPVPVVVDPKFKHFFAYRGATVFKPNRRELERAMGAALDIDHPDALPQSLDKLGVDNLLLTLGAEGMVLVTKDQEISRLPAIAREVFDVSGAGDTVTAWVGTALGAGASVREAARLANYAAGIEVGKLG